MDVSYPAEAESFRAEVQTVLAQELPPSWPGIGAIASRQDAERFAAQWRQVLYRRGLLGITWPAEYGGRGLSRLHQVVLMEELARAGVPFGEHTDLFGIKMLGQHAAPLGHGGAAAAVPAAHPVRRGPVVPGFLRTRGGLRPRVAGDPRDAWTAGEWVIDGQKMWTSVAHRASWIFLLARTDPRAGGHRGISFLLCPLEPAGHRDQADQSAHRGQRFQRGVLHRRTDPR